MLWWLGGCCVTLVVGGWGAHEVIATKGDIAEVHEQIMIAASQAQTGLDQIIEDLTAKIARIERKVENGTASAGDIENLRYWRGVLERVRRQRALAK